MASDDPSSGPGDWIEELFPPAFSYTVEELLKKFQEDEKDANLNVFQKSVKYRISEVDIEKLKNVYEKVWLMTKLEKEEKAKREEAEKRVREKRKHKKKRVKPESATTLAAVVADPSSRVSEASESTDSQVDLHDSCIWDSSEIEVLRKVFKTAKTENLKLTAELVATKDHLERLQSKHKKKCDSLDQSAKQLSDAKKANQRLNILSKNLKAELDKSNAKVDYLREELLETGDERAALAKETHALQLELDRERIERRRLEILLEDHNAETLKALRLQDSKLRVQHETEVGVLQRKLKELTLELHEERKDHTRTKRGLDHLRTHFSSLPLEESDTTSQGPVVTDQLIEFTY